MQGISGSGFMAHKIVTVAAADGGGATLHKMESGRKPEMVRDVN